MTRGASELLCKPASAWHNRAMRILPCLLVALPLAVQSATGGTTVAFNREIAPIMYHHCSPCHRPGEAAPFPLLSYQDVKKKGKMMAKVTASHLMPPWKAEPASYPYRDKRRLTGDEIAASMRQQGGSQHG